MAMTPRDIVMHEFNKQGRSHDLSGWVGHIKNDLIYQLVQWIDEETVKQRDLAREVEALRAEVEALKNPPEGSLSASPWIGGGQS